MQAWCTAQCARGPPQTTTHWPQHMKDKHGHETPSRAGAMDVTLDDLLQASRYSEVSSSGRLRNCKLFTYMAQLLEGASAAQVRLAIRCT